MCVRIAQFLLDDFERGFGLHGSAVTFVDKRGQHQPSQVQGLFKQAFGLLKVFGVWRDPRRRSGPAGFRRGVCPSGSWIRRDRKTHCE